MPQPSLPANLDMKELFLNVSLNAISADNPANSIDLTGRKSFSAEFWREGKGFGITNISIETKTNLQPIIDITFKDLFGQLIFGDTTGGNVSSKNSANITTNSNPNRYSVLFDWPPPKFLFTFKGYLGAPVTWILNLKKTSTKYVASDGSYEIQASFVPNVWGFLADIPFLFLLATKKLKEDYNSTIQNLSTTDKTAAEDVAHTINDLIKIGKRVQTKSQEATKEYEGLNQKLSLLKAGGGAISGLLTLMLKPGEHIDGTIAGKQFPKGLNIPDQDKVKDPNNPNNLFQKIIITLPKSLPSDPVELQKALKELQNDSRRLTSENYKIIALIGNSTSTAMDEPGIVGPNNDTANSIISNPLITNASSTPTITSAPFTVNYAIIADHAAGMKIIENNLTLVDLATKSEVYQTTKDQLGSLTISEVFSRLAGDAAFIIGSILDAGNYGSTLNASDRNDNKKNLIGKAFPLMTNDGTGEQIPATDVGIEKPGCEMEFVQKFITAISEGIAANAQTDDEKDLSSQKQLFERINNLEILSDNPYIHADYKKMVENLLIRSGIAAFITRSKDPNAPGGLNTTFTDDDSVDSLVELAGKEIKNIPDSVLTTMPDIDQKKLLKFCDFFSKLFSADGKGFLINDTSGKPITLSIPSSINAPSSITVGKNTYSMMTYPVILSDGTTSSMSDIFSQFAPVEAIETADNSSIFYNSNSKNPAQQQPAFSNSIDYYTFKAGYLYHNNLLWSFPHNSFKYPIIYFSDPSDISNLSLVKNNSSDATYSDIKKYKNIHNPIGLVSLTTATIDDPHQGASLQGLNGGIALRDVFDYSVIKTVKAIKSKKNATDNLYYPDFTSPELLSCLVKKPVTTTSIGSGVDFMIYSNSISNSYSVFDLFGSDQRSIGQRAFLVTLCAYIVKRFNDIDTQTNSMMAQVLGKAESYQKGLYQQMHNIYQQWAVLSLSLDDQGSTRVNYIKQKGGLCHLLENDYNKTVDIKDGKVVGLDKDNKVINDTTINSGFRYDFPMQRANSQAFKSPINVAHSIIDIEPLYKPNANTTVLNLILNICTKNNFLFIPIPGNSDYTNINQIFKPQNGGTVKLGNVFHVLFTPTPESRAMFQDKTSISDKHEAAHDYDNLDAFRIDFGSVGNTIVSNINVSTEDNKPTAESILNLQKLVDKNNTNKSEGLITNSTLSIMEGRSYKMSVECIGNAQISPMQFFIVNKAPIFGGLYQIMSVKHSITPNNMKTEFEGMRMRFSPGFSGIVPITLESLAAIGGTSSIAQPMALVEQLNNAFIASTTGAFVGGVGSGTIIDSRSLNDLVPTFKIFATNLINQVNTSFGNNGTPYKIQVISTYRNFAKQAQVYNQGRTTSGAIVTNAQAGDSFHNWKRAIDIGVFDLKGTYVGNPPDDIFNAISVIGYQTGIDLGMTRQAGLLWGGDFNGNFKDRPHWEWRGGEKIIDNTKVSLALLKKTNPNGLDDNYMMTYQPTPISVPEVSTKT